MRSLLSVTVVALSLAVLPAATYAESTHQHIGASTAPGLVVRTGSWGPLKLGMTNKQAQKTGMVSTRPDHCAPGYEMTRKYVNRGYVVWKGTFPAMKVGEIIITGTKEHTTRNIHIGSTLRQLRHAYPGLSKVYSSGQITGQVQTGNDLYIAYIHKAHVGTLSFQFAYGARPKPSSKIAMLVIAPTRAVYWGC